MEKLEVALNGLELSMMGPKGKERLKLKNKYPDTELSRYFFSQLGLMHLVAPYFPKIIQANFGIVSEIKKLVGAMYQSENHACPIFELPKNNYSLPKLNVSSRRVAVAYSAGKDSMWNMWWAQEKYGADNVLGLHVSGLNRNNASKERKYSIRQQKEFGFEHFQIIDLLNGSRNTGYNVMRSRDMFLVSILIPLVLEFGASKIITEGFEETKDTEPFTGQPENMKYFNKILSALGIPIEVAWRNKKEMDVVKDLLIHRPSWLPYVCNCFSSDCYVPNLRRYWKRKAPTFFLYDSQCGSCVKCRIVNLARILYDPATKNIQDNDVRTFLKNTENWIRTNRSRLADMVEGSFLRDFFIACKRYEVETKLVA